MILNFYFIKLLLNFFHSRSEFVYLYELIFYVSNSVIWHVKGLNSFRCILFFRIPMSLLLLWWAIHLYKFEIIILIKNQVENRCRYFLSLKIELKECNRHSPSQYQDKNRSIQSMVILEYIISSYLFSKSPTCPRKCECFLTPAV